MRQFTLAGLGHYAFYLCHAGDIDCHCHDRFSSSSWYGVVMKRFFAFLVFGVGMLALASMPSSVSARQATDTPSPTVTATPFYCAPTETPTSVFSSYEFGEVAFPTPCLTCPTYTPGPSPTSTATATFTPSPTTTPLVGTPTISPNVITLVSVTGYEANDSASCQPYHNGLTCAWSAVEGNHPDNSYIMFRMRYIKNAPVYLVVDTMTIGDGMYASPNLYNGIVFTPPLCGMGTSQQSCTDPNTGTGVWTHYERQGQWGSDVETWIYVKNHGGTVAGDLQSVGRFYIMPQPVLPTPGPTQPTVTPTPSGCIVRDEPIVSDLIGFDAGTIVPGECYTIMPEMVIDIPESVQAVSPYPLTEIGVPKIELCVSYWTMTLRFLDFDVFSVIVWMMNIVCAIILYREFRS